MGPFPSSNGYTHILVAVDYVTKWVEAIPTSSADHNTSIKMLKEVIFPRFGVPRYLMTDGGSCRCQNRRISGRGSRTVRLGSMVTGDGGHDVYPGSGPLYGGNTLLPA